MSGIGIAIAVAGFSLIGIFGWMFSLSVSKHRDDEERKAREASYRLAMQKARDQERKEREFKAETGHIPTILFLAKEAERNNLRQAYYWYDKAAKLDSIMGMYGIVRLSQRMPEDFVLKGQANFWQTAIAGMEGDVEAKFATGQAFVYGHGIEQDATRGNSLIAEAATEGCVEAMLYMGDWQCSPENLMRADNEALAWFMQAAQVGDLDGMMKVGLCYLNGIGIDQSTIKGCYWLERASECGHAPAMYYAGDAWSNCSEPGPTIAYVWLFLSAHFEYNPARILRDQVASNIGVDIVVGLQSIAKPLLKKIASNTVKKHSIIRALNKVYKRDVYFPSDEEIEAVLRFEPWVEPESSASVEKSDSFENNEEGGVSENSESPKFSQDVLDFTQDFLTPKSEQRY